VRDKFRWTLTRPRRAFDTLLAANRIEDIGFQLNLSNFRADARIYQVSDKKPVVYTVVK
jgi:hypothetical protein